ncbi:MAG: transcriptional regulator [Parvibaculaceae bacterium]
MSRDQRLALQDQVFQAAAKEEDAARQKVRANMQRLRALRLAKEAADAETVEPAPVSAQTGRKAKSRKA